MNGFVFEVKRFAVHDGPGLRTTLFLKGCPLRCPWCQNPEGLHLEPRLWYKEADCLRCGNCVAACQERALALDERVHIDQAACVLCKRCLDACPTGALLLDGREVSADEAEETLLQDAVFYAEGGGITLSGGEVMAQWPFALELLRRMRARGVDTAIETACWSSRTCFRAFWGSSTTSSSTSSTSTGAEHRRVLGESNELILANYRYLVEKGADVLVRTPLIPGYTATEANIRAIARFVRLTDANARYELLNFNPLCRSKYAALEEDYPVSGQPFSAGEMEAFYAILREEGIANIVRGVINMPCMQEFLQRAKADRPVYISDVRGRLLPRRRAALHAAGAPLR